MPAMKQKRVGRQGGNCGSKVREMASLGVGVGLSFFPLPLSEWIDAL